MKGKIQSSRMKKTIAIVSAIAVLAAGAVTGVTMFLKDDGTAQAASAENQIATNPVQGETTQNPTTTPEPSGTGENEGTENEGTTQPVEGDQTAQTPADATTTPAGTADAGATARPTTAATTPAGAPTGAAAAGQPTEFITFRDRLISEDFLVGWVPTTVPGIVTGERDIFKPTLEIVKNSYTESDMAQEDGSLVRPEESKYNSVTPGELIVYEIKVINTSDVDANNIKVYDVVPENTTLIEVGPEGKEENGKIVWNVNIPKQTEVALRFLVSVNDNVEGSITNVATVDGRKTNETGNAVIKSEKTSEIYRAGKKVNGPANIGDEIKYTITVENTGNIDTTTFVKDTVPENTKLVSKIMLDGNEITEEAMTKGMDVTVKANAVAKLTFTVEVEKVDGAIENTATVGRRNPTETVKTSNLELSKTVSDALDGEYGDSVTLKVGQTAYFKIILKNTGSEELNVAVNDAMSNNKGIDLYDGEEKIGETVALAAGEEKTLTGTYVMTQEDVDNQKEIINTAKASDDTIPDPDDPATIVPEEAEPHITVIKETASVIYSGEENEEEITETTRVRANDVIIYTINVKNDGNVTLKNVKVTDSLNIVSNDKEVKAGEEIDTIASLAPGEEKTYTVNYTVTQEDVDKGEPIKNTAVATDGKTTDDDDSDKDIPVNPDADITVTKVWEDDDNKVGVRPETQDITVTGLDGESKTVTLESNNAESNTWTTKVTGLRKYDKNGNEIEYTAKEDNVPEHYTKSEDGLTVTNTIDYDTFKQDVELK
ncbi:MAG: DUF11 domain-containing protein, partial [Clostridia bacterium]|nr:DUF11 domain-containing protein [Clostridia bacterium]